MSLRNLKICVEKTLPIHKQELENIRKNSNSDEHYRKLSAAFFTRKIWPKNSKIRIGFLSDGKNITRTNLDGENNVDPLENQVAKLSIKDAVKEVVKQRIIPLVNLDISFVEDVKDANVRVDFDPDKGAWAYVGTDHLHYKTGATVNLGWFDVPTTTHEFCHMLGMVHEHQNPRGKEIEWNDKKVFAWAKETQGWSKETTETNILNKYKITQINGSNFDPLSVMLYFFPASLTLNNVGTKQNLRLSGLDAEWISKMYPHKNVSFEKTANTFYENAYNQSLQSSIDQSKSLAENFDNSKSKINFSNLLAILLFLIVLYLGYKLYTKRN